MSNQKYLIFTAMLVVLASWSCPKPAISGDLNCSKGLCKQQPQQVEIKLENRNEWGRDDELYVKLRSKKKLNWKKTKLFAGDHLASQTICPESLLTKSDDKCFKIFLSALPDLPHGDYQLKFKARLVYARGRPKYHTQSFNIRISRLLWSINERFWHVPGVTTREGLLVLMLNEFDEDIWKRFLVAVNSHGETVWKTEMPQIDNISMLGNHRGLDVVLVGCYLPGGSNGHQAVNARTGEVLSGDCSTSTRLNDTDLTLLQGGPDKDLVVLRKVVSQDNNNIHIEACRFTQNKTSNKSWGFDCRQSGTLFPRIYGLNDRIFVRQTPDGSAKVFIGSFKRYWCTQEWNDKKGWSKGCIEEGPPVTPSYSRFVFVRLLGSEHILVSTGVNLSDEKFHYFDLKTGSKTASFESSRHPQLVDESDELIFTKINEIYRLSAAGDVLSSDKIYWGLYWESMGIMEGGNLVLPILGPNVMCLKPDMKACWEGSYGYDSEAKLLGVLPMSPTRSIVVYTSSRGIFGSLFDSSGLKKDAPWPIMGHDLCRTFNASVPIDNCWDGPRH